MKIRELIGVKERFKKIKKLKKRKTTQERKKKKSLGFVPSKGDTSLFSYCKGNHAILASCLSMLKYYGQHLARSC